ncbi:MAG: ribosomal-processing cysteine protease Prp [Tissierellia bacterium]|nr:ribosomal-processing cysteine protease Prp [Tissierellia bacterium]
MTKIKIYHSNGNYYYLKSWGHADSGTDEDIVCAGISTLTQSLYFTLLHFLQEEDLQVKQEDGFLEIEILKQDEGLAEKTNLFFLYMITGLELLKDNYPDYLTLNIMEVQR